MVDGVTHTEVRARTIALEIGIHYQEHIGKLVMCSCITVLKFVCFKQLKATHEYLN